MIPVFENYTRILGEVNEAASRSGRTPGSVRIVAVSKTVPRDLVQVAIDAGIRLFGENRIQEARAKIPELKGEFSFHLVGHLQSNKSRDAVGLFDLIHSVDKVGTARRIDEEAARAGKRQEILVQVNTSGEVTKNGAAPDETEKLCEAILGLEHVVTRGLMTIGPLEGDEGAVRASFAALRELLGRINGALGVSMTELSMGMSSDYRIAVEEGATIVRIGTAIFGTRT